MTGTERMYGIGRVLADVYDDCWRRGIAITPDVQHEAQMAAWRWLCAHPLTEPTAHELLSAATPADGTNTARKDGTNA